MEAVATLDSWAGRLPEVSVTVKPPWPLSPLWPLSMPQTRDKLVPGSPLFDYSTAQAKRNQSSKKSTGRPCASTFIATTWPEAGRASSSAAGRFSLDVVTNRMFRSSPPKHGMVGHCAGTASAAICSPEGEKRSTWPPSNMADQ